MAEQEGRKRVRLALDQASHKALRVVAAQSDLSMTQYVEAVVMDAIRTKRVVKAPPPNTSTRPRGRRSSSAP